jgi:hypothetical protein
MTSDGLGYRRVGTMRRIGLVGVAGALVFLLVGVGTATAATKVTITVTGLSSGETFTTTGGVLCASGDATTDFDHFGGGWKAGSFHLTKTLECPDGTLTINVDAATVFGSPTDQGGWSVVGGTGAYAGLRGGGDLVGTYIPDGIIDLYTGVLRS